MSRTFFLVVCLFLYAQVFFLSQHDHIKIAGAVFIVAVAIHTVYFWRASKKVQEGRRRRTQAFEVLLHSGK